MDILSRPVKTVPAFYTALDPVPGYDFLETYCVDRYRAACMPEAYAS
jgi:hypothetical protein